MCKVRLLRAEEIDCRAQQTKKEGCSLLLYKDARCDMAILDETYGEMNWQRSHEFKNGKCYCSISVWDVDKKEWIRKEDVGVPSNTEGEKGEASDSFKRAAVNFGIGRELYSAPFIWVKLADGETTLNAKTNKYQVAPSLSFRVAEIGYNSLREIDHLVIVDNKGKTRFTFGQKVVTNPTVPKEIDDAQRAARLLHAKNEIKSALTMDVLKAVWARHKEFQHDEGFIALKDERKEQLRNIAKFVEEAGICHSNG